MLELTCPLDSVHIYHFESASSQKQSKVEYFQLLAKFDRLRVPRQLKLQCLVTIYVYQPASVNNLLNLTKFFCSDATTSKLFVRKMIDDAACKSIFHPLREFS